MNFMHLFFSFNGRIRRSHFWVGAIVLWLVTTIVMWFTLMPAIMSAAASGDPNASVGLFSGIGLFGFLWSLFTLWPGLALYVKRFHDRDKSGLWILLILIPIIGWIWVPIECFFLDGTPGPNKYGPSPKGLGGAAPAVS